MADKKIHVAKDAPPYVVSAHVADVVLREIEMRKLDQPLTREARRAVREEIIDVVGLAIMQERGIAQ